MKNKRFIFLLLFIIRSVWIFACMNSLVLSEGNFRIVVSDGELPPIKLAVETLQRDFKSVMGFRPSIVSVPTDREAGSIELIIVNESTVNPNVDKSELRSLDGFESHRLYADASTKRIYLTGKDMRGAIYAIYTFSEKFLDVLPLWFFSSWRPQKKEQIEIPCNLDYFYKSPQVRYRAWFPNDTELFTPWRQRTLQNNEVWLETMLRLKLNTVEMEQTVTYPDYKLAESVSLLHKYGLILSSTHHTACNNNLVTWKEYWCKVRGITPPKLLLSDEKSLREFWQYSIETVCRCGQENLWTIAFRGIGDQPYWAAFEDAPVGEKERAEVINRMLRIQLDMIKERTGNPNPFVRVTFYDELSDLLAKGYLRPPVGDNILWTFVAARRDHYPNDDIVSFDTATRVKLGYYMNFQFTSTGAHLAAAEGPWKMEFNFRYVNSRRSLALSVVNAGNLREFVMELSANASMMWNMVTYDTDEFLYDFCVRYFGKKHAKEVMQLYRDYYHAYWEQKSAEFPGLERQFIFHDLRYARVFKQISEHFEHFSPNPLKEIIRERVSGRSFRIEGSNQVDSLLSGMERTFGRFDKVAQRCAELMPRLPEQYRCFFHDNLSAPCHYMAALSHSLYHFLRAYKYTEKRTEHLDLSIEYLETAQEALYSTQHDIFTDWYAGDKSHGKFNIPAKLTLLHNLRDRYGEK